MIMLGRAILAALAATAPVCLHAGPIVPPVNPCDLTMQPVSAMAPVNGSIINGKPVGPGDFPASYYVSAVGSPVQCSATVVGPRAVLTAAHCVGDGKTIVLKPPGSIFRGTCVHHPDYKNGDRSSDVAICALTTAINTHPENLSLSNKSINKTVLLAGFGCTSPDGSGGNDGKSFLVGLSNVSQLPGSLSFDGKPYPNYFATTPDWTAGAPAVLCDGDSGGAAFCLEDPKEPTGSRTVCGVNSSVDCAQPSSDGCKEVGIISYLVAINQPSIAGWIMKRPLQLCGVGQPLPGCRKAAAR